VSRIDDVVRLQSLTRDAGIVQGFEKKSAFASSVAPAIIMIAVARSGNNNLCHIRRLVQIHIVTPAHSERPVPQGSFSRLVWRQHRARHPCETTNSRQK
jgi:hypothetical protein